MPLSRSATAAQYVTSRYVGGRVQQRALRPFVVVAIVWVARDGIRGTVSLLVSFSFKVLAAAAAVAAGIRCDKHLSTVH